MAKLRSFQVALFSNMITLDNKIEYVSKLTTATNAVFDGEPTILPIPKDAPPEIPRVVVKSKDEKLICNTSINRVDLFFNPKKEIEMNLENVKSEYLTLLKQILNFLNETYRFKIYRIGMVANLILDLTESSNQFISKKYLKDNSQISDTFEVQLNVLNKINLLSRYKANRWLRIITSREKQNIENDKFLSVNIDINTLPDVSYDFDSELVTLIFNDAVKNMQSLIAAHYVGI